MFGWLFKFYPRSPVVEDIAGILRNGPLNRVNVDGHGISELGCDYLGQTFVITWYSRTSIFPRSVVLGGENLFATSADARYLLRVAKSRADNLFSERIQALEQERVQRAGRASGCS